MEELKKRHRYGLFTQNEIRGLKLPENSVYFDSAHDRIEDTQNTGKDGLCGPSENGIYPGGQFSITTTHGGGYYFIPPIKNSRHKRTVFSFMAYVTNLLGAPKSTNARNQT